MHDLDLLVPAALLEHAIASELLRDRPLPHLARLVAHAAPAETMPHPLEASPTTCQAWVFARRAGVAMEHVNVAELAALACGVSPAPRAGRYLVEPAHFSIARDHLLLDDPRHLDVTLDEAHALADAVEPVLSEAGWRLQQPDAATRSHWFVDRDDGVALTAPSIERAIGANVASWQPRTISQAGDVSSVVGVDVALDWRRCVNEVQMVWFGHPVNAAREAVGRPAINTLWLSGNGEPRGTLPRYATVASRSPLYAALPTDASATRALETFDALSAPARDGDWGGWRDALAALDERVADALGRQSTGAIGDVTLILCGADVAKSVTLGSGDTGRFWRRWKQQPPLAMPFAEGALA